MTKECQALPIFMTIGDIALWLRRSRNTVKGWLLYCRARGFVRNYGSDKKHLYRASEIMKTLESGNGIGKPRKRRRKSA